MILFLGGLCLGAALAFMVAALIRADDDVFKGRPL